MDRVMPPKVITESCPFDERGPDILDLWIYTDSAPCWEESAAAEGEQDDGRTTIPPSGCHTRIPGRSEATARA